MYIATKDANGNFVDNWTKLLVSGSQYMAGMADYNQPHLGNCFDCMISRGDNTYDFYFSEGATEIVFQWVVEDYMHNRKGTYFSGYNWNATYYKADGTIRVGFEYNDYCDYDDIVLSLGNTGQYRPPAIPEPETYAMLLAGLGLVGIVARRRRSIA